MALMEFKKLVKEDLSAFVKKKPTFYFDKSLEKPVEVEDKSKHLDYLEWAKVIELLYEYGAETVRYGVRANEKGYPAHYVEGMDDAGNLVMKFPFVRVWVSVDGESFEIDFPVIDGNRVNESVNQLEIHIAQQRAFVKAVAINTGLGLKLWMKEEEEMKDRMNDVGTEEAQPFTERMIDLAEQVKRAETVDELQNIWVSNPDLHTDITFKRDVLLKKGLLLKKSKK